MKSLFEYLDYRDFVRDVVESKRAVNPSYSFRLVAHRLECNPGFFHRVLKGERNLAPAYVLKLAEVLKLSKREQKYFELLVSFNQSRKQAERDHYYGQLQAFRNTVVKEVPVDSQALYEHWFYVALRELLHLVPCTDDDEKQCRVLGRMLEPPVKASEVRTALQTLTRLGAVSRDSSGRYQLADRLITTGNGAMPQVVVNRILMEFNDLAERSIDRHDKQERRLSTLTFTVSETGLERVRERMDEFRKEVLEIVDADRENLERVYHMNLHLFPLSAPYKGGSA